MNDDQYKKFRGQRVYLKRQSNYAKFKRVSKESQALVYLKSTKRIIAEYDITNMKITTAQISLSVEPIYNAPPSGGVRMDDLALLTLNSFSGIDEWNQALNDTVFEISEEDYRQLSNKLMM